MEEVCRSCFSRSWSSLTLPQVISRRLVCPISLPPTMAVSHKGDTINITSLALHIPQGLGPSAFNLTPPPPCPAYLTLSIRIDDRVVPSCSSNDAFGGLGINYSSLSKEIIAISAKSTWVSPQDMLKDLSAVVLEHDVVHSVQARVKLPKASLAASDIAYEAVFSKACPEGSEWTCTADNVRVRAIIGLHPYEQQTPQWLELDVTAQGYEDKKWSHTAFADEVYNVSRFPLAWARGQG